MNASRRYALVTFLTLLPTALHVAPMVLLMLDRGLDVPTIALIWLTYSLTVAVLELPTGGLADVLGRRAVLIAAAIMGMAGLVLMGLAQTAALFAGAAFLRGVGRALGSGPAEAWYVDTVHATQGPDAPIGPGLARGSVAGSAALAIGTIAGGLIPLALTGVVQTPLAIPVLIGAGVEAVRLVVVIFALPEPRHAHVTIKEVLSGVPVTVRKGLGLSLRDGALARIMLITGAIGIALGTIELLTPSWLATVTGTFETAGIVYGLVAALGFAAHSAGAALSARVVRLTGAPARASMVGLATTATALALLGGSTLLSGPLAIGVAAAAYCLIFVGLGINNPAAATITHSRVAATQRATVLSVQSLSLQLAGAIGVNALSRLSSQTSPIAAFLLVSVVIGLSGLLLRSHKMSVSLAKLPG